MSDIYTTFASDHHHACTRPHRLFLSTRPSLLPTTYHRPLNVWASWTTSACMAPPYCTNANFDKSGLLQLLLFSSILKAWLLRPQEDWQRLIYRLTESSLPSSHYQLFIGADEISIFNQLYDSSNILSIPRQCTNGDLTASCDPCWSSHEFLLLLFSF